MSKSMKALSRIIAVIFTVSVILSISATIVFADPKADVENTNPWGTGGQITLKLSGCSGYDEITVVVEFSGKISDASGWGFDSYSVNGNRVTAKVSKDGPNSWGYDSSVGIQVNGSDVNSAKLISVSGGGKSSAQETQQTQPDNQNPTEQTTVADSAPAAVTKGEKGDDWLSTNGSKIVDQNGNEVWITGCNWFGYNTGTNLFDGVWNCNLDSSLKGIADHGFNFLRVPISAQLLLQWKNGDYPQANYNQASNPELNGLNSLEIFDYVLERCEAYGIKVMLDIHSANTDASGHNHPVWYTDQISEAQYIESLAWVADRYKDNDTILAYDLKNEPHGKASETTHAIWNDSDDKNNWKKVAEKAANAVLDKNPNVLIVVEGIQIFPTDISKNNFTSTNDEDYYNTWWGANLMGVKKYPIDLGSKERNQKVVYSPHDYGPLVYKQPWFEGNFTYDSLYKDAWHDYWLYIVEDNIAPVFIGEWGGFMQGDNLTWMKYLRQLIGDKKISYTFWCYNANSGDTGGLVKDDFQTWDEEKYALVKEVLWMTDDGKFIGLDHKVPLGSNGIALSDYTGNEVVPNVSTQAEPAQTEIVTNPETGETQVVPVTPDYQPETPSSHIVAYVILTIIAVVAVSVIVVMVIEIKKLDSKN